MTNETEVTTLAIRKGVHRLLLDYCNTNGQKVYFVVEQAIQEYINRHTRPDIRCVEADSDPVAAHDFDPAREE